MHVLVVKLCDVTRNKLPLGAIQQLRGQNFAIFLPPPPLRGQFLYPERGQKQTFFAPLPTSSYPRSY